MTRHHLEVEDKYDVDESTPLPDLSRVEGVTAVDAPVRQRLDATYFDTADLALATARVTLRRRTGGDDAGWHLKLPADGARHEVRLPLGDGGDDVPATMQSLLVGLTNRRRPVPVVRLRTQRTVHRLRDPHGRVLAEVADDRVEATDLTAAGDPRTSSWREWEVELVDAGDALLPVVAATLAAVGAIPSRWPSKLARALGRDRGERPAVRPLTRESPAAELVRAHLRGQWDRLTRWDPLVRCEAPDAVHQLRVTTRRLRAALSTFRPLLGREVTDPLRDELGWLGAALGDARDAEVMLERLRSLADAELGPVDRTAVRARIDQGLGAEYAAAYARAREVLESDRYLSLVDRLRAVVDDPPWTDAARLSVKDVVQRRVRHDWRRLERAVDEVRAVRGPAELDARLHAARKAAKRVRYSTETLVGVYGDDAERLVEAAAQLQEVLGAHQDSVITQARLLRLKGEAADAGEEVGAFETLEKGERARADASAAGFGAAWDEASAAGRLRWPD